MRPADRVHMVITDRLGGASVAPYDGRNLGGAVGDDPVTVRQNRDKTASEFGLDPARVVYMRQVHSADVAYVTEPFGAEPPALDAVFTAEPGLGLCVLVADCAPVLVADAGAGLVGAAHSGRAGTTLGVVPALVRAMAGRGADPARMTALIGPAACGLCYEVSAELRDQVSAGLPSRGRRPAVAHQPLTCGPESRPSSPPGASPTSATTTAARSRRRSSTPTGGITRPAGSPDTSGSTPDSPHRPLPRGLGGMCHLGTAKEGE